LKPCQKQKRKQGFWVLGKSKILEEEEEEIEEEQQQGKKKEEKNKEDMILH
jgi:hypothetical protein